jgi:hypothetical protein
MDRQTWFEYIAIRMKLVSLIITWAFETVLPTQTLSPENNIKVDPLYELSGGSNHVRNPTKVLQWLDVAYMIIIRESSGTIGATSVGYNNWWQR